MHTLRFHKTGEVRCYVITCIYEKKIFFFLFTVETIDLVEVEINFIILFTCCIDFNLEIMKINKILDERTIEIMEYCKTM